jgi:hypothetical protein
MIAAPLTLAALGIEPAAVDVLAHGDRCSIFSREISEATLANCRHEQGR